MDANNIKKLIFRSKNRGCKEMDIVLTRFAENKLLSLTAPQLALYEQFIEEADDDLWAWVSGKATYPEIYAELGKMLND